MRGRLLIAVCLVAQLGTAAAQPAPALPAQSAPAPGVPINIEPMRVEGATPPPNRWQSWSITGTFIDDPATVMAFLDPIMADNRLIDTTARNKIAKRCAKIGYDLLRIQRKNRGARGFQAVLVVAPRTLVRRIIINVNNRLLQVADKVFRDEVVRRMRLRAGTALARDPATRTRQLVAEQRRVADYLRNEGYFEARVQVREKSDGPHAVRLLVTVTKGPRYKVGKITIVGNTALEAAEIGARFHHKRGCVFKLCLFGRQPFSRTQLTRDVQSVIALYQKRGYPGVRVRSDFNLLHSFKRNTRTVEFTIVINERRQIDAVFEGNNKRRFPDSELEAVLTFAAEGSYDEVEIDASAQAIRAFYQRKGYYEAQVTWQRERFEGVLERIIFRVDEGDKLAVRSISFVGNQQIGSDALSSTVKTQLFRTIALFGGFTTSVQLEQDVDRIKALYRKHGFADAKVALRVGRDPRVLDNAAALAAAIAGRSAHPGLHIRFTIDEGPKTVIKRVEFAFDGPHRRSAPELAEVIRARAGEPFHDRVVQADQAALQRSYFQRGYPHARVRTLTINEPDGVVIKHKVSENREVRVGKLIIRGNFHTRDWVIRDELALGEGGLLTLDRVDGGQQNLRVTGLFNTVRVDPIDFEKVDLEVVNILVNVQERKDRPLDVEGGFGYSTDTSWFGEAAGTVPNALGVGLNGSLRVRYGGELKTTELKLASPRWIQRKLLGVSFTTESATFWRREQTDRFGDLDTFGTRLAFTKTARRGRLRGWQLGLRYDFRQFNREVELTRGAGPSDDLTKAPVTTRTGSVGPRLTIDRRRDSSGRLSPIAPVGGFKVDFRALFADKTLGGSDRFVKLSLAGQHIKKLGARVVITNSIRYDHGIPLGGEVLLPEVERFFAGGDTTMRGFEEDRFATEIIREELPPLGQLGSLRVDPAGGNIRFIHNFEVQLEVWKLWGMPVATALFLDTGIITNSLDGFGIRDLRHSVGAALFRWLAPFGSLSIEYALPLDPKLGDNPRGRMHFNMGTFF